MGRLNGLPSRYATTHLLTARTMSTTVDPPPLHGLRWGIKCSFTDYVRRTSDGQVWVGDGAFPLGTHEVFFKLDSAAASGAPHGEGEWQLLGDVRFTAHAGMLFVRLARPRLVIVSKTGKLIVTGPDDEPLTLVTAALEPIEVRQGTRLWHGSDVRLHEEGVEMFNSVYPSGELFEPMLVQLPAPET